ncbi:hypothetical protein ACFSDD_17610 [Salipiger marinus]|uniref:hypothetical protein n=2 Tax=Salipiger marinus TaxID=555512 RepID=UPI00363C933C
MARQDRRPTLTLNPKRLKMTVIKKSYRDVGKIDFPLSASSEVDDVIVRAFGDLTEDCHEAEAVLANWAEVARFNIGTSAVLAIMQRVRESLTP